MRVESMLRVISRKKEKVIRASELIISQVEKITSYQLDRLKELEQKVFNYKAIKRLKQEVEGIGPSKSHLKQLDNLLEALGCEKLSMVVSGSTDNTIRVWEDGQARVLEGHTGWVYSVAVSLEKEILVSASQDSTIRVWSLATAQVT